MTRCAECDEVVAVMDEDGDETEALVEGAVEFDFQNRHYAYCPGCIAYGEGFVTDFQGTRVPFDQRDIYYYYDGDSINCNYSLRQYQYPAVPDEGDFTCTRCGGAFYGDGIVTEDTEVHYCRHCAENYCRYEEDPEDDESGRWFQHPRGRQEPAASRRSPSLTGEHWDTFPGVETSRFLSTPLVGIEFEHAPVRPHLPVVETSLFKHIITQPGNVDLMTNHSDGSIAQMSGYTSSEIVTFPSSGDRLNHVISEFYRPFAEGAFSPGPEHPSCGFHVHVGSRFLFKIKGGVRTRDLTLEFRRAAKALLAGINKMCREYISSTRRANSFCSSLPGVRDKDMRLSGADTMVEVYGCNGYPSVAVRTLGTIEFRLWPSSNSIRNTKARVELSQKLINYYDFCFMDADGGLCLDQTRIKELSTLQGLCRGGERKKLAQALGDLLTLSPEAVATLEAMSDRFSPFTGKKTFFKFSDLQVTSMVEEDSLASSENTSPDGVEIVDVGDTTVSGESRNSGDIYISLGEAVRVYPSTNQGAHAEATKSYAKGER
jgi:hypothetical protein